MILRFCGARVCQSSSRVLDKAALSVCHCGAGRIFLDFYKPGRETTELSSAGHNPLCPQPSESSLNLGGGAMNRGTQRPGEAGGKPCVCVVSVCLTPHTSQCVCEKSKKKRV